MLIRSLTPYLYAAGLSPPKNETINTYLMQISRDKSADIFLPFLLAIGCRSMGQLHARIDSLQIAGTESFCRRLYLIIQAPHDVVYGGNNTLNFASVLLKPAQNLEEMLDLAEQLKVRPRQWLSVGNSSDLLRLTWCVANDMSARGAFKTRGLLDLYRKTKQIRC